MSDDRLSHHERGMLEDLEESLQVDDPGFVMRFDGEARALGRRTGRRWSPLGWLRRWRNR
jgi:hypothetical protein